jgi:hypothetical protein
MDNFLLPRSQNFGFRKMIFIFAGVQFENRTAAIPDLSKFSGKFSGGDFDLTRRGRFRLDPSRMANRT